ncbi:ROK family glucokinase [Kitasatospora purpeofusca]|uniref:ROK family glucokinase n=1 Tax=Kitasatospora purpeofusca TaxID=67352 RepID=UPI0039B99A18
MTSPHGGNRPPVLPTLLGLGPRAERRRRALPAGLLRLPTIGVDIGGTKVVAGVVDGEGKVLEKLRTDTPHKSKSAKVVEDVIVELVLELADRHDVHAVGVGAAGWVDVERSTVLFAPHLNWRGEPLREALSSRLRFPVIVENDANAAAWAEWRFGAGRGEEHMVMLTLGTGIGGAVVRDGYVDRGKYGLAGEFGHMQVVPGGHRCPCGNRGCWEQYSSGNALVRDARELVAEESPVVQALLARAGGTVEGITGPLVTEAARAGDPTATELLYEVGTWLGVGIANLAAALDPGRFVIGGGVSEAGDLLLTPARDTFRRTLTGRGFRPESSIVHAALGNEAGLVGAADLARQVARRFRTIKRRRVERAVP